MPSFSQTEYCLTCKKTVASIDGICRVCGSKVDKRKWFVRFRVVENGKYKNKCLSGFNTKKEANKAYADYIINQESQGTIFDATYEFDALIDKDFRFKQLELKESSMYSIQNIFELFITPYFKGTKVNDYNKQFLSDWQTGIYNKKKYDNSSYHPGYLKKVRQALNNFLNWCSEEFEIDNKLKFVRTIKTRITQKEMLFWEIEEFNYFIKNCDFNLENDNDMLLYTFFNFSFFTGLRIGEIQAFSESDLDGNIVSVNKTYSRKTKNHKFIITQTKNYKNYTKHIPHILVQILDNYIKWKRSKNLGTTYLFGGDEPLPETTLRRKLENYIIYVNKKSDKKIGRITPHGFRHSYVSMLVYLGCNTKTVAELIGDTEEQVIETYSHLYKNEEENAIVKMNKLIEDII